MITDIPCPLPFDSPLLAEWTRRCAAAVERFALGTTVYHLRAGLAGKITGIHTDLADLEPVFTVEYTAGHLKGFAVTYHLDEIGDSWSPEPMLATMALSRSRGRR